MVVSYNVARKMPNPKFRPSRNVYAKFLIKRAVDYAADAGVGLVKYLPRKLISKFKKIKYGTLDALTNGYSYNGEQKVSALDATLVTAARILFETINPFDKTLFQHYDNVRIHRAQNKVVRESGLEKILAYRLEAISGLPRMEQKGRLPHIMSPEITMQELRLYLGVKECEKKGEGVKDISTYSRSAEKKMPNEYKSAYVLGLYNSGMRSKQLVKEARKEGVALNGYSDITDLVADAVLQGRSYGKTRYNNAVAEKIGAKEKLLSDYASGKSMNDIISGFKENAGGMSISYSTIMRMVNKDPGLREIRKAALAKAKEPELEVQQIYEPEKRSVPFWEQYNLEQIYKPVMAAVAYAVLHKHS